MTGIVAELAACAAGKLVGSLIGRPRAGTGSFAKALLEAQQLPPAPFGDLPSPAGARALAREAAKIASLARRISGMGVSSDEADRIAANLWALAQSLKASAGKEGFDELVENALADFASRTCQTLALSGEDRLRLMRVAREYLEKELPGAAGLDRTNS